MTTPLAAIVADIKARRCMSWLPLDKWGPKCAGCGSDDYCIDGFCSIECRDYHCDDDIPALLSHLSALTAAVARLEAERDAARKAASEAWCSQCGQYLWKPACGPTHAKRWRDVVRGVDDATTTGRN